MCVCVEVFVVHALCSVGAEAAATAVNPFEGRVHVRRSFCLSFVVGQWWKKALK